MVPPHHLRYISLSLFSFVISNVGASSNLIPLSLGPDFQSPISESDILRGFKVNIAEGEDPLKQHVFKADINPIPFSTTYTKSEIIRGTQEVKNMLEIEGSLSVSYGPLISGEGSGRYLQNKVNSKRQATILYRTRRVAYARSIDVSTIEPTKNDLYNLSSDEVADIYGTKFIDQMIYGAQLDVIFTVTSTTDIDMTELEAQLKGKIGVGPLSVSFSAKFEKQEGSSNSEYSMSIEAQASGVNFNTPANPSFNQTNELIERFNEEYDKLLASTADLDTIDDEENVLNQLSPVGFTLASIADYVPKLDEFEIAALDSKMSELRDIFYSAIFWKSQLLAAKKIQESIYTDPKDRVEIFQPYEKQMDTAIELIDKKVEECLIFRRQPLAKIIGRDGVFLAVPNPYPGTQVENDMMRGLKGNLYIPSPLYIQGKTFDDVHYIGFALPENGRFQPWMGGKVRRDSNDRLVTKANTVEDLKRRTSFVVENAVPGHLEWGDMVEIRNFNSGNRLFAESHKQHESGFGASREIDSYNHKWIFVRSKCETADDYAFNGPCYEIVNAESHRRIYAKKDKNGQNGLGGATGSVNSEQRWVLKGDKCNGRDCFFVVNAKSGRRLFQHNEILTETGGENLYTKKYTKKWPHCANIKCYDRKSREELKLECNTIDTCDGFSFTTEETHEGSGCLKVCGSDDSLNGYGSDTHDYWEKQSKDLMGKVGARTWVDEKSQDEKWFIENIGQEDFMDGIFLHGAKWGDAVEIKNFDSERRLYVKEDTLESSKASLGAVEESGLKFQKWIFARTTCQIESTTTRRYLSTVHNNFARRTETDLLDWSQAFGMGSLESLDIDESLWSPGSNYIRSDGHFYIRRLCPSCSGSHKDIIYKRLTPLPSTFDVKMLFLGTWSSTNNKLNEDFELYSSMNDAQNGSGRWTYCNYDDNNVGFPRDCGPSGYVPHQWNSLTINKQEDYGFYIWRNPDTYVQSTGTLGSSGAGGTCLCPSGLKYVVGDNYDGCQSLQCVGGISELFCDAGQYAAINGKRGWGVVCDGAPSNPAVSTSAPTSVPAPCYEIINAASGLRIFAETRDRTVGAIGGTTRGDQKWKLEESDCNGQQCFFFVNVVSGQRLFAKKSQNGERGVGVTLDGEGKNDDQKWLFDIIPTTSTLAPTEIPRTGSPTKTPTFPPTLAPNVTGTLPNSRKGGMVAILATISVILVVIVAVVSVMYLKKKREKEKNVQGNNTFLPTGVVFQKDPLGLLEDGQTAKNDEE